MAKKPTKKAARLPSGLYAWRGRAVPFGKLPKAERVRFRGVWARKAKVRRKKAATARERSRARKVAARQNADRKSAREWLDRRTRKLAKPGVLSPREILEKVKPAAVLDARAAVKRAHDKWRRKTTREKAWSEVEPIYDTLGDALAEIMPQLWYYH